jgi:HPt (histidine-containing phosphotransfer) domain-containing protein
MGTMDETLENKLAELHRAYASGLPTQVQGVRAAISAWMANPSDAALQTEAKRLAHRIAGTAGSYGLIEVGMAARAVELLARKEPGPEIGPALDKLEAVARAAAAR